MMTDEQVREHLSHIQMELNKLHSIALEHKSEERIYKDKCDRLRYFLEDLQYEVKSAKRCHSKE